MEESIVDDKDKELPETLFPFIWHFLKPIRLSSAFMFCLRSLLAFGARAIAY
jgi:hypothetical protein